MSRLNFRRKVPCRFRVGDPLSISDESFCTSTSSCFLFSLVFDSEADVVVVVVAAGAGGAAVSFPKSPYGQ